MAPTAKTAGTALPYIAALLLAMNRSNRPLDATPKELLQRHSLDDITYINSSEVGQRHPLLPPALS
jgi:hypothetical protein